MRCIRRVAAASTRATQTGRSSARCSNTSPTVWNQPDEGIWEVRGGARQFTYSKVMAWVAFDRGIRAMETFGLDGPMRALARRAASHSRGSLHARLRSADRELRAVVRLEGARRQPAAAADGGLPAGHGPARARDGRSGGAPAARRRVSAPLRHATRAMTACPAARGRSWRAASGWLTRTC